MNGPNTDADVAVIGAGPAGLAAALMLARAARPTVVIDAGPGRNQPSTAVHGFLGHDGTAPADLRSLARSQLSAYPSVRTTDDRVASISRSDGSFVVELEDGSSFRARRVALATGIVDDLPPLEGLDPLWGHTVVHCPYCHGWELRDQPTAVLVLEPLNLMMALKLTHLTDDVVVLLNGAPPLSGDEQAMLDAANIPVSTQPIARLVADDQQLRSIVFTDGTSIDRSVLYVHPPSRQATTFAADLGCRLLDDGSVEVDDLGHTSVPGVHAAGDMARRPSMPVPGEQVVIAAAEGAAVGIAIDQELVLTDMPTSSP